jgi:hypothetical protein
MRITESTLRSIVRQEILRESVAETAALDEADLNEATQEREWQGKVYRASPGAISVLKKYNLDIKAAVDSGAFNWVVSRGGSPYAVAQAAHIVATGRPYQKKPKAAAPPA